MAVVSGITTVSLSWRCFLIQEIVPFNTERRLREECVLSLAFVSEHLCAFFVSKVTSSSWLMLSKLNSLTGTTSMYRPVLVFLKDLCQAQKYYTFFFVLYVIMLALWSSFVFWMPHGPSQINTVGSGLGNEVWNLRDLEPV